MTPVEVIVGGLFGWALVRRLIPGRRSRFLVGCWWDVTESRTRRDWTLFRQHLVECDVNEVCVMVNDQTDGPYPWTQWTADGLEWMAGECRNLGIVFSIMVWPRPSPDHIEALLAGPVALAAKHGWPVEYDVETFNWQASRLRGYATLDAAADELVRRTRAAGVRVVGSTTYPFGVGSSAFMGVIKRSDYCAVQAYSVNRNSDPQYAPGAAFGPGRMQLVAAERMQRFAPHVRFACGLAAYGQTWPGVDREATMAAAFVAATNVGAASVRYWSAKHFLGPNRNSYAWRFIHRRRKMRAIGERALAEFGVDLGQA